MKRKKIRNGWKEYFNFSARERRGSIFLSLVIFFQIIFLVSIKRFPNDFPPPDEKIVSDFLEIEKSKVVKNNFKDARPVINNEDVRFFNFDPNRIQKAEWLRLGLSEKQSIVIQNYLSKGGKFRVKKDLKKMYCISENQYHSLEPFILLPDTIHVQNSPIVRPVQMRSKDLDISTADSASLVNLSGIGPVLATRIIKYREMLGGFVFVDQIKEVYGISDTVYDKFKNEIVLPDSLPFRFVKVNTDSFNVLSAHPYIKYKLAKMICNFRTQNGSFKSADELKALPLITEENFRKLAPYIWVD
jgi:competence ComEA-like helix-hairpin-helix protein